MLLDTLKIFRALAQSIFSKCMYNILETNALICCNEDKAQEQTNLFASCSSSSLCRREACSLSLALH